MVGTSVRFGVCSFSVILGFTLGGLDVAIADTSAECRDLAARFSSSPEQLEILSLTTLANCVTSEIAGRMRGTRSVPAPAPEAVSQPLAPQQEASPPPERQWGAWPAPAPWAQNWPPQSPWDK